MTLLIGVDDGKLREVCFEDIELDLSWFYGPGDGFEGLDTFYQLSRW